MFSESGMSAIDTGLFKHNLEFSSYTYIFLNLFMKLDLFVLFNIKKILFSVR